MAAITYRHLFLVFAVFVVELILAADSLESVALRAAVDGDVSAAAGRMDNFWSDYKFGHLLAPICAPFLRIYSKHKHKCFEMKISFFFLFSFKQFMISLTYCPVFDFVHNQEHCSILHRNHPLPSYNDVLNNLHVHRNDQSLHCPARVRITNAQIDYPNAMNPNPMDHPGDNFPTILLAQEWNVAMAANVLDFPNEMRSNSLD